MRTRLLIPLGVVACLAALIAAAINVFPNCVFNLWLVSRDVTAAILYPETFPKPRVSPHPVFPYRDDDGYDVMSAWIRRFEPKTYVVIRQESPTLSQHELLNLNKVQPEFKGAAESFLHSASNRYFFESRLNPDIQYRIMLGSNAVQLWEVKRRRVDYVSFSPVGFNPEKTRAVMYARFGGNTGCIPGPHYFVFRYVDKGRKWVLDSSF